MTVKITQFVLTLSLIATFCSISCGQDLLERISAKLEKNKAALDASASGSTQSFPAKDHSSATNAVKAASHIECDSSCELGLALPANVGCAESNTESNVMSCQAGCADGACKCLSLGGAGSAFPNVRVTGFFHLDGAYFSQNSNNIATLGDIDDGLGFRRARLAAAGNVSDDVSYIIEFDIAQSQARFVDVFLEKNDTPFGNIRIGRYRHPFGMSELTSIRELPFLERPLTFTAAPFRQTGISFFDTFAEDSGTWAISGYRYLSDNFGNVFADGGGYGFTTRLTATPIEWVIEGTQQSAALWHVGVDYSYNEPGRGLVQLVSTNEVLVGQNPNIGPAGLSSLPFIGVTPFVNTGLLAAESIQFVNIEQAFVFHSFAVQSEMRWTSVNQTAGGTANFPGGYVQARYMLTGEQIPYNRKAGVLGRVVPHANFHRNSGFGAWEVLARLSHLDLNDNGINGRRLTDFTFGCNWYWNKHTKLQLNWINSQLNDVVQGDSTANTVAFRAQIDF